MVLLCQALALSGIGAIMLFAPAATHAEDVGNAANGLAYARAHCAECHAVESRDDVVINLDAPNFVDVANTPGMTSRALAVWLQTSHPTMPNFLLPAEAKDDVIAYIMTLKTKAPR
jgi:mono/diheme cytochrome c family protein